MKLLGTPTLQMEEIPIYTEGCLKRKITKFLTGKEPSVSYIAGRTRWLPLKVQLDNINELHLGEKHLEWSDNEYVIQGYFLTALDPNSLKGLIAFDHAREKEGVDYEPKNV